MSKKFRFLFHLTLLLAVFSIGFNFANAQDDDDDEEVGISSGEIVREPVMIATRATQTDNDDEDDTKVTGATVRGRIFYEDTNRPARFVSVSLVAEKNTNYSEYYVKSVKTDENGEFVLKNVKAGTYLPFIKSDGVLNPQTAGKDVKDSAEQPFFEKITVNGLGEIQVMLRAKRGGALSGRIQYADGEAAVGVKVEVLLKSGGKYANVSAPYSERSVGSAETDDRGVYRLKGLPAGTYIVRVNEPFSHSQSKASYGYERPESSPLLKTYYPEGESSKNAKDIEIVLGQEQTGIDVTLPERQLFALAGKIVSKKDRSPLADFEVKFQKISDRDDWVMDFYMTGNTVSANKTGDWTIKSLPKGKYQVTVSQKYVYRDEEELKTKKSIDYPSVSKEIEITGDNIENIIFEIPTSSSLSGTIVMENGKPLPKYLMINAFDAENKKSFTSDLDYSERDKNAPSTKPKEFTIRKMVSGKYTLGVISGETYIKSATFNGRDITNSPLEIREGDELNGVRIVLASDFGKIKGKVTNYQAGERIGVLALKPNFSLNDLQSNAFSGVVMPNGEFQISAKPGEYAVIVIDGNKSPKSREEAVEWLKNLSQNAPKVTVKSGETVNVTVEIAK
ncbi:MAG TPA: hypothetical protein PKY59_14540 [Pyrinomonadaceae bacterium]|nr:hypothetical protein [Pyrinomonadaceae bacterium]